MRFHYSVKGPFSCSEKFKELGKSLVSTEMTDFLFLSPKSTINLPIFWGYNYKLDKSNKLCKVQKGSSLASLKGKNAPHKNKQQDLVYPNYNTYMTPSKLVF